MTKNVRGFEKKHELTKCKLKNTKSKKIATKKVEGIEKSSRVSKKVTNWREKITKMFSFSIIGYLKKGHHRSTPFVLK